MSVNQIQPSKQLDLTDTVSEAGTTITQAVASAQQQGAGATRVFDANAPISEQQELQMLRQIISTWRELEREASELAQEAREKKVKQKALEEMILRIMKKYNIGALDLKGSGGRLLYRRSTTKQTLNPKTLTGLLADHLKSETAAAEAIKYINEHRGAKVKESLLYEKP
jgi:predicted RNase H-like nuclease (RuvC/YqgF family)